MRSSGAEAGKYPAIDALAWANAAQGGVPAVAASGEPGGFTVDGTLMVPCDACYRVQARATGEGSEVILEVIATTTSPATTGGGGSYAYQATVHPLTTGTYRVHVVHVLDATYDTAARQRHTVLSRRIEVR